VNSPAIDDNMNNTQAASARQDQEAGDGNPHTDRAGSNKHDGGHKSLLAAKSKEVDHRSFVLKYATPRNRAGTKLLSI
jgi:hypothetical protein